MNDKRMGQVGVPLGSQSLVETHHRDRAQPPS